MQMTTMTLTLLAASTSPASALLQCTARSNLLARGYSAPAARAHESVAQQAKCVAHRLGRPSMNVHGNAFPGDEEDHYGHWSSADDEALNKHIENTKPTVEPKLGAPHQVIQGIDKAWVLIFNPGREDESVYTLQGAAERADSSYVVAFERTDDANRFAHLLQAQGFDLATPQCWKASELTTFCETAHFDVSLMPDGALVTPPTQNEYFKSDEPERIPYEPEHYPGDGSGVPDAYVTERQSLEALFSLEAGHMPEPEPMGFPTDREPVTGPEPVFDSSAVAPHPGADADDAGAAADPYTLKRQRLESLLQVEPRGCNDPDATTLWNF